MSYEEIEVVEVKKVTEKACLIDTGDEEIWIPLSVIEENGEEIEEGYSGPLYIAKWFCDKEGIEY